MKNKNIRYCKLCNDVTDTTGPYCQKCYNYLRVHPEGVYPLPEKGEIVYATNGDPICHICGMAYRKLGNHIRNRHHMTQEEYREEFKLHHNSRLSNTEYQVMMRDYNSKYYKTVVEKNLLVNGILTRLTDKRVVPRRKIGNYSITKSKYTKDKVKEKLNS